MIQLHNPTDAVNWLKNKVTGELRVDSREIQAGDGFIAWPGAAVDGRQYVKSAIQKGAAACLVENAGIKLADFQNIANQENIATYDGLKNAIGLIASQAMNMPSKSLNINAITGTNGKTTTAWWLTQALQAVNDSSPKASTKCFMVGTLGVGVPNAVQSTGLTTPDPVLLHQKFREYLNNGFRYCAIEASSIGIEEHRLDGTDIQVAIFTNFTQDHLDYHGSMQAYWAAKLKLFNWPTLEAAVINIDDAKGLELVDLLSIKKIDVWTVAIDCTARLTASNIVHAKNGLKFNVREGDKSYLIETKFFGKYNISNLLGVIAAMRASGIELSTCVNACKALTAVPGRMDVVMCEDEVHREQPLVVVDYAHTPDALKQALVALRPSVEARGGKLICIFGCGGNRDTTKRPLMAQMAQAYADAVVVTADNSRHEKPELILSHIVAGFKSQQNVVIEENRAIAIAQTIKNAYSNDVILIAGKGHENYQDELGVKTYFSDKEQAAMVLSGKTVSYKVMA